MCGLDLSLTSRTLAGALGKKRSSYGLTSRQRLWIVKVGMPFADSPEETKDKGTTDAACSLVSMVGGSELVADSCRKLQLEKRCGLVLR